MKILLSKMSDAISHLWYLHDIFSNRKNFDNGNKLDFFLYKQNEVRLNKLLDEINIPDQLYSQKGRQMILADIYEYIFFGRGYYIMKTLDDRKSFIKLMLHFVNMLMCYEMMTVSDDIKKLFITTIGDNIPGVKEEEHYNELKNHTGSIGLKRGESQAPYHLDRYFDSFLPKTAGGLWHELLVYIFLLRNDFGYIIPLLLNQRLMGLKNAIVPPDFLLLTHDKRLYGIEVGTKKEIQSGSFSLQTAIPTAAINTENSRTSDRCPICKRWILFCPFIIENYAKIDYSITKPEIRCLETCDKYKKEEIVEGRCIYTKYSRPTAKTLSHAKHKFTDGYHYHYICVLGNLDKKTTKAIVDSKDTIALKTHFPHYSGLEELKPI